jgi:dTDP-glucose pyrophosphorylase
MIKIVPYEDIILSSKSSIRYAMQTLNKRKYTFFVVVNSLNKVLGSITDGDIRRAILKGLDINQDVTKCMNKSPIISYKKGKRIYKNLLNKVKGTVKFLPILDKNNKILFVVLEDKFSNSNTALIMAGGFGKRLGNKTKSMPKPLLKIGDRSVLETLIKRLESAKYKNIFISTFYLHSKIESFIKNRNSVANIKVLIEKEPLGTAGSISMLNKEEFDFLTVINGDIVSDINLEALEVFHKERENDITITVADYAYTIPFGVVNFDKNHNYKSLVEKPEIRNFILSGIYCLNKSVCSLVEQNFQDMPNLISKAHQLGYKIGIFPLYEYWNDIGTLNKFNLEIKRQKNQN